jgi:orotidine-5'-phosphate decarboxylase
MPSPNPIFCAVDTSDLAKAERLAMQLKGHVYGLKLGLEFFTAFGAQGYKTLAKAGLPIFLDLKLHDIPNTVAGAVASLLPLNSTFITIHASGGTAMMKAAAEQAAKLGVRRPKLLGVTVLTSMDGKDLASVGQIADTKQQVMQLARLAKDSGLDGVICSPEEVKSLRHLLGPDFILMVPGIRPNWAAANDQKRVMTPKEAMLAGATYLVIGRPITGADNPADAAQRIVSELAA